MNTLRVLKKVSMKVTNSLLEVALLQVDSEQNELAACNLHSLIERVSHGYPEPDWAKFGMLTIGYLKSLLEDK